MSFVQGLIEGYESGARAGAIAAMVSIKDQRVLSDSYSYVLFHRPRFTKTFATYIHAIDDFYANYRDIGDATPGEFFDALVDGSQITMDQKAVVLRKNRKQ